MYLMSQTVLMARAVGGGRWPMTDTARVAVWPAMAAAAVTALGLRLLAQPRQARRLLAAHLDAVHLVLSALTYLDRDEHAEAVLLDRWMREVRVSPRTLLRRIAAGLPGEGLPLLDGAVVATRIAAAQYAERVVVPWRRRATIAGLLPRSLSDVGRAARQVVFERQVHLLSLAGQHAAARSQAPVRAPRAAPGAVPIPVLVGPAGAHLRPPLRPVLAPAGAADVAVGAAQADDRVSGDGRS